MSSGASIEINGARGRSGKRLGGWLLAMLLIWGFWLSLPGRAEASVASGALSQLAEPFACIGEEEAKVAECGNHVPYGLSFAYQIEVSPDGMNAYSVGVNGDVIEYSRDLANGALSVIGCFSSRASSEPCAEHNAEMEVVAVGDPSAIAISPDGRSVYVVGKLNNTIAEFERSTEAGEYGLLKKIGCVTNEATLSECETTGAKGLFAPYGVTVSPEGENVYVAGFGEDAVAEFKRSGSGKLSQLAAPNECIGDAGSGCGTTAIGLEEDIGIQASAEGKDIYVAAGAKGADGDVAALARGAEGALKQLPGKEACISETLGPECTKGEYIRGMEDLAISPDGKNVYASSFQENAVVELARTETGALKELEAPNECVSATALTGCEKAEGIRGAVGVAISPDGTDLYISSQDEAAVAAFERNSGSGALKQLANPCVTEQGSGCGGFGSEKLVGLDYPRRLTVSPDGTNVYVAGQEAHAVAELARTVTPKLSRIDSSHGSPAGGEEVYVTGSGFAEGAKVSFGGVESPEVVVTSASTLTAKSPLHAKEEQVAVKVENEAGASAESSADHFTYTDRPIVAGLTPTVGDETGGTTVTITGTELGSATKVDFGGTPAGFTVNSAESITATSPAATGTVEVTVQTPQGTSFASAADKFAFVHGTPHGVSGLFLSGYCGGLGDPRVTLEKGEQFGGPGFAYENWACVEPDGAEVLLANTGPAPSLANACEVENPGVTVYAYPSEPNSAFSWGCYVIVPPSEPPRAKEGGGSTATIATNHPNAGGGSSVPVPQLAVSGNVAPVSGTVLVRLPGTTTFVPLSSLRQIPFGTVIEATHGHVSVTTTEPDGATQTGEFFEGEFVLKQERNGLVVAELTGGNFSVCPTARERAHKARATAARASGKHVVRKLWANAHGSFSTKGNYAAGAVQGTEWLTEDLCEGTLIRVTRDKVRVTNLVNHRHVEVTTGHKYLAKAP
jgi:DNA-binding beta-propeller fold protein YncE